jgi:hypothetical protein
MCRNEGNQDALSLFLFSEGSGTSADATDSTMSTSPVVLLLAGIA